jgi:hypothetical protein
MEKIPAVRQRVRFNPSCVSQAMSRVPVSRDPTVLIMSQRLPSAFCMQAVSHPTVVRPIRRWCTSIAFRDQTAQQQQQRSRKPHALTPVTDFISHVLVAPSLIETTMTARPSRDSCCHFCLFIIYFIIILFLLYIHTWVWTWKRCVCPHRTQQRHVAKWYNQDTNTHTAQPVQQQQQSHKPHVLAPVVFIVYSYRLVHK